MLTTTAAVLGPVSAHVREKCRADSSLAIAHDLEHLSVAPPAPAKKGRGRRVAAIVDEDG